MICRTRTVLLWRVEPARRLLYFGTDRRSPKHAELANTPWALLVFYEPAAHTQLRLHATVSFRSDDPLTLQAWRGLPLQTRRVFATPVPPGHAAPVPATVPSPAATLDDDALGQAGYRNFELLEVKVVHLDWLYTPPSGHRRAAFTWKFAADTAPQATWIYP